MDSFGDRTISKLFSAVIVEDSQNVSACPPREQSNLRKIWNKFIDNGLKNKEADGNKDKDDHRISDEFYKNTEAGNEMLDLKALCNNSYCNIKMQDPCEICCCKICRAEEDSPCEGVPRGQRRAICECDIHEKLRKEHDCCDACEYHGLRRV